VTWSLFEDIIAENQLMPPDRASSNRIPMPWAGLMAMIAAAATLALLLTHPHVLLDVSDRIAFAVCHRIAARTFTIAGRPLPLCARCTGAYLGAAAGLVVLSLRRRGRAGELPATKYLIVFGLFLAAWALDGLNSLSTFFAGAPHLYEPNNFLRLATGTLEGLAIAAVMLPAFNRSLWSKPEPISSVGGWQDMIWMLAGGALIVCLVISGLPFLLYPLAILSGLAVVAFLGAVNCMFGLSLLRQDGGRLCWREAAFPVLLGLALAVTELIAAGMARSALEVWLGLAL
jgi:uncharacterized membrane protein